MFSNGICNIFKLIADTEKEIRKKAHMMVVPLKTSSSLARHICGSKDANQQREAMVFLKDAKVKDWSLNMLEVAPETVKHKLYT